MQVTGILGIIVNYGDYRNSRNDGIIKIIEFTDIMGAMSITGESKNRFTFVSGDLQKKFHGAINADQQA